MNIPQLNECVKVSLWFFIYVHQLRGWIFSSCVSHWLGGIFVVIVVIMVENNLRSFTMANSVVTGVFIC